MAEEVYLGDAVYASCDGWQIWLRTDDGHNHRIALEPGVFANLLDYGNRLRGAFGAAIKHAQRSDEE